MKPAVSIIIPYHNDPDVVVETLESLYDTIDIDNFEVILVDDCSKDKVPKEYDKPGLRKIRHFTHLGVGHGFETGVGISRSDNLILMGSDIRFLDNGWCRRMLNVVKRHPKGLVSTVCGSTESNREYYGADIMFYVNNSNLKDGHPMKSVKNYRSIFEGKWRPRTGRGVYQVPSLMGAFYGMKKEWFNKICGFELHYQWGVLEPYISMKSWRMGGEVLVDSENKVLHIFGRSPRREAKYEALKYNQLMIGAVVFGNFGAKYAEYLEGQQGNAFAWAGETYMEKWDSISWFARYFQKEAPLSPQELEDKIIKLSYFYNLPDCEYEKP